MSENKNVTGNTESGTVNAEASAKKKNVTAVILIAAVVIIALLAIIIVLLLKKDTPATVSDKADNRATLVTEENADEVSQEIGQANADASYRSIMSTDWTFDNGTATSKDAYVENSETNSRTVYFDVTLQDSKELVYSSPYLPLGSTLDAITLSKDLDAGDYPAVVTYYLVDDDHNPVADVSVAINIHVLN